MDRAVRAESSILSTDYLIWQHGRASHSQAVQQASLLTTFPSFELPGLPVLWVWKTSILVYAASATWPDDSGTDFNGRRDFELQLCCQVCCQFWNGLVCEVMNLNVPLVLPVEYCNAMLTPTGNVQPGSCNGKDLNNSGRKKHLSIHDRFASSQFDCS